MSAWLFLFYAIFTGTCLADSGTVSRLVKFYTMTWESGVTATGVAIAVGGGGDICALVDAPPRLVLWQSGNNIPEEFEDFPSGFNSPADLASDGGIGFMVVDPYGDRVVRYDRLLRSLPSIFIADDDRIIEPISICRVTDGSLFLVNRADDDIWQIKMNGKAVSLGWSKSRRDYLNSPLKIEYSADSEKLVILDGESLVISNLYSLNADQVKLSLKKPTGISVWGDEAWIVGDGLVQLSLTERRERFHLPVDSLKAWNVFPVADIAVSRGELLYILPVESDRVQVMKIVRNSGGYSD